jgi:hypothetical protein
MSTDGRARLVYLIDPGWGDALLPALRDHFAREPQVAVLVERRGEAAAAPPADPTHRVHRAPVAERDAARSLPPELRLGAGHLRLVQPLAPVGRAHEDTDLRELVARTLALEPAAAAELWWRIAPRVLARLELGLGTVPGGSSARVLLGRILDELPGYDPAHERLTVWLDRLVDRYARAYSAVALGSVDPVSP